MTDFPEMPEALKRIKQTWRDHIKVHSAADLFPMMSDAELKELGEDILKNGLKQPIVFGCEGFNGDSFFLIDGRNRLSAMEALGLTITYGQYKKSPWVSAVDNNQNEYVGQRDVKVETAVDAHSLVASLNVYRRHLTGDQKRTAIAALLRSDPEKSNRAIAEIVKADDKTVSAVRKGLEASAEIPHSEKRRGKDGRTTTPKSAATPASPLTAPIPSRVEHWLLQIHQTVCAAMREICDQEDREDFFEKIIVVVDNNRLACVDSYAELVEAELDEASS